MMAAMRTATAVIAAPAIASAAPRGMLHARSKIPGDASLKRLLLVSGGARLGYRQAVIDRWDAGLGFEHMLGFFERLDRFVRFRFGVGYVFCRGGKLVGFMFRFESAIVRFIRFGGRSDHAFGFGLFFLFFDLVLFGRFGFDCLFRDSEDSLFGLAFDLLALRLGHVLGEGTGFFLRQFSRKVLFEVLGVSLFGIFVNQEVLGGLFLNGRLRVRRNVRLVMVPLRERLARKRFKARCGSATDFGLVVQRLFADVFARLNRRRRLNRGFCQRFDWRGCRSRLAVGAEPGQMLAGKQLGNLSFATRFGRATVVGAMRSELRGGQLAAKATVASASAAAESTTAAPTASTAAEIAAVAAVTSAVTEVRAIVV